MSLLAFVGQFEIPPFPFLSKQIPFYKRIHSTIIPAMKREGQRKDMNLLDSPAHSVCQAIVSSLSSYPTPVLLAIEEIKFYDLTMVHF